MKRIVPPHLCIALKTMETDYLMEEDLLMCRMCVGNLLQFKECYSVDEEVEKLILNLTSISFDEIDEKSNLMICIKCYETLKSFEEFKELCIKNQLKFSNIKQEEAKEEFIITYDQMPQEENEEDFIEYEATEDEEIYEEESEQFYTTSQDEVAGAVEKILEGSEEERKPRISVTKRLQISNISKGDPTKSPEKTKGKESYQRLLQQCEVCDKMIEKNRMEGHINKHNNHRPFSCPECEKTFYCKQLLRLHRTTIHTNMLFKCEVCNKMFPSTRALYSHNLRHRNQDRYQCEFCDRKFNNTNSLNRHLAIHSGVREFVCPTCGVGFYRKFNLTTHIKNVHQAIKNYVCPAVGCKKKFGYSRLLRDHIHKNHGEMCVNESQITEY